MKQTKVKHTHKLDYAKSSKIKCNMLNSYMNPKTSETKWRTELL